jgi:hypothetical protein
MAALAIGLTSSAASAGTFSFVTPAGSMLLGEPVSAAATITTNSNGTVSVTLANTQQMIHSATQLVTDLFFSLSGPTTGASISASATQILTVNGDGSVTPIGSGLPGWGIETPTPTSIHLCDIGPGACTDPFTPAHGLIGPAAGGAVPYPNANNSIAGNGSHNPVIGPTVSWLLTVPGVTDATTVTSLTFSFTTGVDQIVPGVPGGTVPEPASLTLLGSGLVYLSARMRRRRRTS